MSNEQVRYAVRFTALGFALIGPAVYYTGVHAQAKSVCQNHVLGRCSNVRVLIVSQGPPRPNCLEAFLSHTVNIC